MSRTALARTHRPRRFDELVGQDHVSSTLRSAVEAGRVGHAYLFCGPRGVGKTTVARVLAMALNCPERAGGEPCGRCGSCERIWAGRTSLDVVEIDAASHRGVDDARDLRERAMYAPSEDDRYKVYILDEAHMLTREAWNALLKVIEEPPPRVIFAFATTEPQKIQQTAAPVLSRCQRFDFRRVSVPDIVARLATVLEAEGVEVEEGALLPVARKAEGGVRDALSLLDQVLSFSAERVTAADVHRLLGLVGEAWYLELFDLVAAGDRAGVFPFVQRLLDAGHDPREFVGGLSDALRALLVLRTDPGSETLALRPESRERFLEAGGRFEEVDLLRLLLAVSDFESSGRYQRSSRQRVLLEVLLLRLVSMESTVTLEELLRVAGGELPEEGRREGGAGDPADEGPEDRDAFAPYSPGDATAGEAPAGETPAGETPAGDAAALSGAWQAALAGASDLGGEVVALRGARVRGLKEGVLRLVAPHPNLVDDLNALLAGPRTAALRRDLAERLGLEEDRLEVRVEASGETGRMTASAARRQRLERLASVDPALREAVEELDLTLKE